MRTFQRMAEIPTENRNVFLEDLEPKTDGQKALKELLQELLEKKYKTLLISGNKGTGKTFMALAFLNSAIRKGAMDLETGCKYVTHYELDLRYKSAIDAKGQTQADIYNRFSNYKFLVIDELGRGPVTDYSMSFLENLISRRYSWGLPTVLITNKTAQELKQMFDSQMLDRLGNSKQKTFALEGKSLR